MACHWGDVVIWMGFHTDQALEIWKQMKEAYKKPFLMEIDDDYFHINKEHPASDMFVPGSEYNRIVHEQLTKSDGLIVSTPYLKENYGLFNKNIAIVENAVNLGLWRRNSSFRRQRINIGWVGGAYHIPDLLMIKDALFDVLEKHKNARFICLHAVPPEFKNHKQIIWTHEFWPINKYPKYVLRHKFDIGIAPLRDNSLNRCKSNLRWLEYSAQGIPTVASPVDHFKRTIKHGETGFLAETKEEWVNCLSSLIDSDSLRTIIGRNARTEVKRNWSPEVMARKYLRCLREIVHAKPESRFSSIADTELDRRPIGHPMECVGQAG